VSFGTERIRFVNFWAMTPALAGYSYTRQAKILIDDLPNDGIPTIVAGDFNASKSPPHLDNVKRLNERGLVSAYHRRNGREHAEREDDPTSYHLWRAERAFHMDFVFVPEDWRVDGVDVGSYEDYCLTKLSDHVPVVVTLETAPSAAPVLSS
jgi:endonuclease/exonuclease/phosphatase family metal-dependent hydrolase